MKSKPLTLKEAIAQGKLSQFIKERITQTGDGNGLTDKILKVMKIKDA